MNSVTIEIRNVYGRTKAYPKCQTGLIFSNMLGTKTLTRDALQHIQRLGYAIVGNVGDLKSLPVSQENIDMVD